RFGLRRCDARNVTPIEISDVSHTSDVSGCAKLHDVASLYFADANGWLIQYDATEVTIVSTGMTKIQTRSCGRTAQHTTGTRRIASIITSSTEMSSMPIDMPALRGMS